MEGKKIGFINFKQKLHEGWSYSWEVRLIEVYLDKDYNIESWGLDVNEKNPVTTRRLSMRTEVEAEVDDMIRTMLSKARAMSLGEEYEMFEVQVLRKNEFHKIMKDRYQFHRGYMTEWHRKEKNNDENQI